MTDASRRAFARRIVLAYLARTEIPWADVPALQALVEDALGRLADRIPTHEPAPPAMPTPKQIAASIRSDGLVSFIDGQPYKVLKMHLRAHGLGPVAYRQRYGLPADYPMVCTDYGARRADIARGIGLGGSLPNSEEAKSRSSGRPDHRQVARLAPGTEAPSRSRPSRRRKIWGPGDGGAA